MSRTFDGVSVAVKANIYFDGKVVSHGTVDAKGVRRTLGLIHPGSYTFSTNAAEEMEITAGNCRVRLKDASEWSAYREGQSFSVPAQSSFEIAVDDGIAEYVCTFIE